jgi:excisionase family DNA binding protein
MPEPYVRRAKRAVAHMGTSESNGAAPPSRASTELVLLTPTEVATLLRTSRRAIYCMVERGQLPGVVRIGHRLLFREAALLDFIRQKSTPSLEGPQR